MAFLLSVKVAKYVSHKKTFIILNYIETIHIHIIYFVNVITTKVIKTRIRN